MSSRKVLWIVLTIVIIASLDLIILRFLLDKLPVLALFLIFVISIAFLAAVPSPHTKRTYKALFLVTLFAFSGSTVGLYAGLFESVILPDDSWIDMSHSAVILHLKNNGLTDWTIKEVTISNITFALNYPLSSLKENLQPGDTAHLIIYYSENIFQWIPSAYANEIKWDPTNPFNPRYPMDWSCSTRGEVSPSTFQNGSSYRVVFTTNGVLKHSFDLKAKFTLDEELNVTARKWLREIPRQEMEIWVRLNNTGDYYSYVYTIQIANVTFYFKPPISVSPSSWEEMRLIFDGWEGGVGWGRHYYGNIYATPTPKFSMFKIGMTYKVSVRTMTNNSYITNVTI